MTSERLSVPSRLQGGTLLILVLGYCVLDYYFRAVQPLDLVHTHFAYVPIVLAGLWYKRKSLLVALALVAATFAARWVAPSGVAWWSDALRSGCFLVVAGGVGYLSERVSSVSRALGASEDKYRLLIDHSLAGIFVHRDGRVLYANGRLGELLGYSAEELQGLTAVDLLHEPDRTRGRELLSADPGRDAPALDDECRLLKRDRSPIWVALARSRTAYEGRPAVLVNVYDVTARKEAEEKKEELLDLSRRQQEQLVHSARLAELGEIAASIAHELNQPLTGIKNYAKNASYMIDNAVGGPEEIRTNIGKISEQVDRASRIINQMRGLTRKTDPQFQALDVNGIVKESVEFLIPQFRLHEIKVSLELAPNLPPVRGDKIRLEQVFLNILTNSRQAMENGTARRLVVKTYLEEGQGLPVVIEISDTGVGFAPEETEKIFTPFYSTKKAGDGTGLGLSISRTIIKEHGGEIEAIGAPGVGSVFKVTLAAVAAR